MATTAKEMPRALASMKRFALPRHRGTSGAGIILCSSRPGPSKANGHAIHHRHLAHFPIRHFFSSNLNLSESFKLNKIPNLAMSSSNNNNQNGADIDLWNGSQKEKFASLNHPGYSVESDPATHVGGWLSHRAVWEPAEDGTVAPCWIKDEVIDLVSKFDYESMPIGRAPKILVLYGSLRPTSFSRKCAYEFARLLDLLGCDVRVYNPQGLPVKDLTLEQEVKVQELRALTQWSDGHVWVSPEMHGTITGVFKNQIDWIPLNTGSVRPTQGKTCAIAQVNGGSQSFNAVSALRQLARWMRMPCSTNQSSIAKAWKEFDDDGRMKDSGFRERVVDVAEEFAKFTAIMVPASDDLVNRYSERKEKMKHGHLLTQAEKELKLTVKQSAKA